MERDLPLKEDFEEHYKELLGDEYEDFIEFSRKYPRKSFRVNTLNASVDDVTSRLEDEWNLEQIPWCDSGFWLDYKDGERYDIGNLPEHQLGYIYVQSASSMIPVEVLEPEKEDVFLDMCAAPGSKTSHAAAKMDNEGLIVANDSSGKRLIALGTNLQRCGVYNVVITNEKGQNISDELRYDKILVDAPCSGTGTINKSLKVLEMWSPNLVNRMVGIQRQLIKRGFELLRKGGEMVYSTCTLEPRENEMIVDELLEEFDNAELLQIDLDVDESETILEHDGERYRDEVKKTLRIHPHVNESEGFFVAKKQKNEKDSDYTRSPSNRKDNSS